MDGTSTVHDSMLLLVNFVEVCDDVFFSGLFWVGDSQPTKPPCVWGVIFHRRALSDLRMSDGLCTENYTII